MAKLPLEGLRIADLTRAYAGTQCTRAWADMGAEVIKIEAVQRIDMPCRRLVYPENDPGEEPWNRGGYFHWLNVGKYGITLDMNNPKGIEIFKRLVKISDVVTENFSPRVMRNWGLDYESLKEIKSDIIMVSMSGFGQTGPHGDRAAYALVMESAGGLPSITGQAGGSPIVMGTGYGDWALGMTGAAAMLVALHYRHRTGHGQHIDVAGREAILCHIGEAMMDYTMNRRVWGPTGNRHSSMAPHGCYRCKGEDEWIAIAIGTDEEWESFCKAIGDPPWTKEERFSSALSRWQNQDELDKLIEEWTKEHDHYEAMQILQQAGVAAGAALNAKEILFDPHLKERGLFDLIEHPAVGEKRPCPRQMTVEFSESKRVSPPRPAPLLGQHNEYVLGELLGMSKEEIAQLEEEQIIGNTPLKFPQAQKERGLNIPLMEKAGVCRTDPNYIEELGRFWLSQQDQS